MRIQPARRVSGELRMPGDKSISHRAAILSALSLGGARISNYASGEDCLSTLNCLRQLGVMIDVDGTTVVVKGVGRQGLRAPLAALDCGNSGSTMRLLAGVLAGQRFATTLTGDASLRARPMKRIIEPLEMMGARITSEDGHAPLRINGRRKLKPISYRMPVESAQVKGCLLLAGLNAKGLTEVIEKRGATRDHTERMLQWLTVPIKKREMDDGDLQAVAVEGRVQFGGNTGTVPGDISSAAYFIAAAALLPGSKLKIRNVGINPTRTAILNVVRSMGADLLLDRLGRDSSRGSDDFDEPFGDLLVTGGAGLAPTVSAPANVICGQMVPQLIDELPMLAVVGSQVMGGISIRDAGELRSKESDRIRATVENLRAMGANVEEHDDGLTIRERSRLRGAKLDSYKDHRIAMAFTIAALLADGESEIHGAECVAVSFPQFFDLLNSIVER